MAAALDPPSPPGRTALDAGRWALPAFAVAYALAVLAGRATRLEDTQLALVWPAAGVAVLWLAHARAARRRTVHAAALVGVTVLGNLATGAAPGQAAAFGAANLLQAAVTVALLPDGFRLRTVAALGRLVLACAAGALASAVPGAVAVHLLPGDVPGGDLPLTLGLWTVRGVTSVLVVAAVALRARERGATARPTSSGLAEGGLGLALLGAGHLLVYATPSVPAGTVLLPLSIWVALRCSTNLAAVHVLCTATSVGALGAVGRGPFAEHPPVVGVLLAQAFVIVVALVVLTLSLSADERAELVGRLREEQQQSAAQAALLETVLDTVDVAILAADAQGRPLVVNRSARALHDLADDADLPASVPLGRVLREGRLSEPLLVVQVPGRPLRTVRSEGRALRAPDGALLGAVVVQTDVTALSASEQQFRAAFEDGPTPSLRLDDAGRVEQANAALRRLLSQPTRRLVGRELAELASPDDREGLRAATTDRTRAAPVEARLVRADGTPIWCEVSTRWFQPPGGVPYVLVQVLDVHARKTHELVLEDVASRDALTGLDNRHVLDRRLGDLLHDSGGAYVVIAYLDLDGFKAVNDQHGHEAGDAVLRAVGARLLGLVRSRDVAARLGGDEFVLACTVPGGDVAEQFAATLVHRIEQALSQPVEHDGLLLEVGVSVGTALAPSSSDADEVLHRADLALYERKRARTRAAVRELAWLPAPVPTGERRRLEALRAARVLDTPPDPALDDLCRAAALVAGVPTALVSLVDEHRQWAKARCGSDTVETSRDVSFCAHVVALDDELHVEDARRDRRFADNPLVTGETGIRSYAGFPLRTPDGHVLGSLCVVGYAPGLLQEVQRRTLRVLAAQATSLLVDPGAAPPRVPAQRSADERTVGVRAC